MKIPVFHDDQHGTAIISGAALLNALELTGKKIDQIKVVFNGAGASAISCAAHYVQLGVRRENIVMCDTKGVIYEGRTEGMNPYKARFASKTSARTLAEAMVGADVFFGLSSAGCVTPRCCRAWLRTRWFSRWPIPIRRSLTTLPWRRVRTPSWPRAGRIFRTR